MRQSRQIWAGTPFGDSSRNPSFKTKTPLSPKETKAKPSALPLSLPPPSRDAAPHRPRIRADGITPVTRLRLLAPSFSGRLQGDIRRRSCPPRTIRRLSWQAYGRLLVLFNADNIRFQIIISCFSRLSSPYPPRDGALALIQILNKTI